MGRNGAEWKRTLRPNRASRILKTMRQRAQRSSSTVLCCRRWWLGTRRAAQMPPPGVFSRGCMLHLLSSEVPEAQPFTHASLHARPAEQGRRPS